MTCIPAMREAFLRTLGESGNVTLAAQAAGLSRAQVYLMRERDPEFAEQWVGALELGVSALEDAALKLAHGGNERLIMFLLAAHRPEKYGQRSSIDINGGVSMTLRHVPLATLRAELAELVAIAGHSSTEADTLPAPLDLIRWITADETP
jgi:hypothetical protein